MRLIARSEAKSDDRNALCMGELVSLVASHFLLEAKLTIVKESTNVTSHNSRRGEQNAKIMITLNCCTTEHHSTILRMIFVYYIQDLPPDTRKNCSTASRLMMFEQLDVRCKKIPWLACARPAADSEIACTILFVITSHIVFCIAFPKTPSYHGLNNLFL